jgi:ferredoxin-fold anticodon binding domain-containing protein
MTIKYWVLQAVDLLHTLKDEKLHWQTNNQARQLHLKHARILAENQLADELKKKNLQLEHDISLLQTQQSTELALLKIKCKQDIKDYQQYLVALDKLKESIKNSYKQLPEAVAFTIHHHAKQLLNRMWEEENFEDKMRHEMQLIQFMTTVHEDASAMLQSDTQDKLPEKTLGLITAIKLTTEIR